MSEKLIRSLHPEIKIANEAEGLVDYIASDETIDCYSEVVTAKGWRFNRFAKNAPFVDSHNYWSIESQLGMVVSAQVKGKQLIERVKWAKDIEECKLAKLGWKMTLGGFLKAVSVGFMSIRSIRQGDADWGKVIADLGIPVDQAANIRRIFLEQDQIELSACIIGANPNALAKAHKEGCVQDGDLAACGFNDEDMNFLHEAAKALEDPDTPSVSRLIIEREMRRITRTNNFQGATASAPATSASTRVGAGEAKQRAADQSSFLKALSGKSGK